MFKFAIKEHISASDGNESRKGMAHPLGPMVFNDFSDRQPLVTMVFDGCQPLVQRCDGNDTSFRSIVNNGQESAVLHASVMPFLIKIP